MRGEFTPYSAGSATGMNPKAFRLAWPGGDSIISGLLGAIGV
jgi:hypothetical protein